MFTSLTTRYLTFVSTRELFFVSQWLIFLYRLILQPNLVLIFFVDESLSC